ncbi:MAG: potassium channel family protein [Candidatus Syntropharchaeia archaeon]
MSDIEYKPINAKDILTEMKDISELMLDLGYSAVLYDDMDIAKEVLRLEERMDFLLYHARIVIMLGARRIEDAEKLSGVLQIASSAEKISNAAGDIAKIVLTNIGIPQEFKVDLREADETVIRTKIEKQSILASKTLGELELETETGMKIIAIRRGKRWIYAPDKDTTLLEGDVLFARGPNEGVPILHEMATKKVCPKNFAVRTPPKKELDRACDLIIDMKNLSELIVGLAYSSVLFYNKEIASEVRILEEEMDTMWENLEYLVLKIARETEDVSQLRGLLHLATSSEAISDAAYEIADVVMRDIELHPVFMLALREADEVITKVEVRGGELIGKTLGEVRLETEVGMFVLAIRRKDGRWIYDPGPRTVIYEGDSLIARGTRSGEERLKKMCS